MRRAIRLSASDSATKRRLQMWRRSMRHQDAPLERRPDPRGRSEATRKKRTN